MPDLTPPEPTLASLRRRGTRRRSSAEAPGLFQADLFAGMVEMQAEPATAEVSVVGTESAVAVAATVALPRLEAAPVTPQPSTTASPTRPMVPARVIAVEAITLVEGPGATDEISEPEPAVRHWTVSGLVRHVRGMVERGYGQVTVEGEISNWRPAGSGHCYFTVKDAEAQLSAVIFRRQASLLRFRPNDGDAVRLRGQLSVYESRGQMQLIVEWMEQMGFGALLAALQRLKEQLRGEGLFDRKRPLPAFPRCIGVVTSLQGAALRDIVKVCRRRHASVQLLIYPAAVQGPSCAAEIAAGLRWFNAHPDRAEVVLVARGGGSWEDLHGFDDEAVVRAIAACTLPVITGLGHATDSTLADLAADQCAPTPSAAAELLTAGQHRVEEHVDRLHGRLRRASSFELLRAQQRLERLGAAAVLRRLEDRFNRRAQRIDDLVFRTSSAERTRLIREEIRLRGLAQRLEQRSPTLQLGLAQRRLEALSARLAGAMQRRTARNGQRLEQALHQIRAMSPLRVLERGYALVYGADGRLLRDAEQTQPGQEVTARLAVGSLKARVLG